MKLKFAASSRKSVTASCDVVMDCDRAGEFFQDTAVLNHAQGLEEGAGK